MIKFNNFKLNGVLYNIPSSVAAVSIGKYIKYLNDVFQDCPEELNEVCNIDEGQTLSGNFEALETPVKKKCYEYFIKVVSYWTNAPETDLKTLDLKTLELAFWSIEFLFGSFVPNADFVGFDIKGINYFLPAENMKQSTLIEFAEAAQYEENLKDLKAGNYIAILDNMAILCRPKGEQYDESKNAERKKLFYNLGLDVGLNVCFFLSKLNVSLIQTLTIYSLLEKQKATAAKASAILTGGMS